MGTRGGGDYESGLGKDSPKKPAAPCKACSDFKSWTKSQGSTIEKQKKHDDNDCPLDKEELGRATWGFLHSMAAYYPEEPSDSEKKCMTSFFKSFAQFYPCNVCATHLQQDLQQSPPEVKNADDLSQWLCRVHNRVNVRLGKPEFDCSRVKERWKDGWKDGSCDL